MKRNISILFYLQRSRINKQGKCPIRCRVTYFKKRKEFATSLFVYPNNWESKQQKAHPPNTENETINSHLSLIRQKMNQAFLFLQMEGKEFEVDEIVSKFKGEKPEGFVPERVYERRPPTAREVIPPQSILQLDPSALRL